MTISSYAPKALCNGVLLAGVIAVLYNTPASTTTIVKEVLFCNTGGVRINVFLEAVPNGANASVASALVWNQPLDPGQSLPLALSTVLPNAGDTLQGWASQANMVSCRISGVEGT